MTGKIRELYIAFCRLNRRRIEHNPLQKSDIIEEVEHLPDLDKSLDVIESIDSEWLKMESDRIKRLSK